MFLEPSAASTYSETKKHEPAHGVAYGRPGGCEGAEDDILFTLIVHRRNPIEGVYDQYMIRIVLRGCFV